MIQNDKFKFVVHKENFLSLSQCQKLMRYLETGKATESELAGNYDENILNKEVRDNKEVVINNKQLNDKLKGSLTLFPAFLCHNVTPVTKGKRYVIQELFIGDHFK